MRLIDGTNLCMLKESKIFKQIKEARIWKPQKSQAEDKSQFPLTYTAFHIKLPFLELDYTGFNG
jgi:hypothetical protein